MSVTSANQATKPFKIHELNEKELGEIPAEEQKIIFSMPGDPDSPWAETVGKSGNKYYQTMSTFVKAPKFMQMLTATEQSEDISHIGFGGFIFKLDHGKVFKSPVRKPSSAQGGQKFFNRPKPEKYVADLIIDVPEKVREIMSKEKAWKVLGTPHYSEDGKVIVAIYKEWQD